MEHRRIGQSDLVVSTGALGSWLTYGAGIPREQTEACTRAAMDAGVTLFDTANVYGRGAAERAWGEILADYPRDSYVLATKVYFPMGDGQNMRGQGSQHRHAEARSRGVHQRLSHLLRRVKWRRTIL